ncbi:MAG TPA: SusC/RagA family TonB-linked outer membrane protein [Prolixibacteraceae bacterium]|nr:SusC/RagA family TonB-linked outer membrane protein [Prolixibacteraceae bacterium]
MKHIIISVVFIALSLFIKPLVYGQSEASPFLSTTGNDSLANVAYGSVHINDLSTAISVVNPEDYLDKHYGTYALNGLSAFIGGTNLWNFDGTLLLVDGVPRDINSVTADEIEQITFLKSANALVLYGSRAANGAILIKTKRGHNGEQVNKVNINAGINVPKAYPNYLGSADYMTYYNQALANDGMDPLYSEETIENYRSGANIYRYPDVDYYSSDYLRKVLNTYTVNADFSGGNDRAVFYALAGFEKQNSFLNFGEGQNEGITRMNIRGNIDLKLNDYVSTYVNVSTVFYDARTANGNYWGNASTMQPHRFSPLVPIDLIEKNNEEAATMINTSRHLIDGKYLLGGSQQYLTNPIADVYADGYSTYTRRQFQYSVGLDADLKNILKGLTAHGQVSIDYANTYRQFIDNNYAVYEPEWNTYETTDSIAALEKFNKDSNSGTQHLDGTYNYNLLDFNVHLDYENTFDKVHNVSAMLIAAGFRGRQTGDFQYTTNTNLGLQLAYNYKHKYYFDFSGAVVNSTKLPENTRVAFSPTLNLAWVLTEEDFLKNSSVFNRLKVDLSAGILNTDIGINNYYLYDDVYSSTAYYSWSDGTYTSQATTISRGANPNLNYVKRKEVVVGVDAFMLNNSIRLKANAFLIKKDGIPVQSYTQYPSFFRTYWPETSFVPYTNFEANLYRGADFQFDYNIDAGDLKFIVGLSGTYFNTKALVREELFADTYRNRAGKVIDAMFGLESEGLFMDQDEIDNHAEQKFGEVKPGDIKYKDQNNDGVIDERDEVMIGRWSSPLFGGVHFTAQWKGFTLFMLGTANIGATSIKGGDYYWVSGEKKYSEVVLDSWTEETKNTATYPRLTTTSGDNNFRSSDYWLYSSDRFDLSKVQLTYALPQSVIGNSFIKGLNIHLSGSNLLTISKNKDIMELNIGGSPQTRFYNLGIKAVF